MNGPMIQTFAAIILLFPYVLEALVDIGFKRPAVRRSPAFYVLVPVTSALTYLSFAALFGHPVTSFIAWAFIYCGLSFTSNLKNKVLGEPLVAPDLETTRHLFIYPEFYVNYVGAFRFIGTLVLVASALLAGILLETSFASHQTLVPAPLGWLIGLVGWCLFLWLGARLVLMVVNEDTAARFGITFDIRTDVARFGLFPLMLIYGILLLEKKDKSHLANAPEVKANASPLPDLVVLQAESYFDVTRLYGLLPDGAAQGWPALEDIITGGVAHGKLHVPVWGASTMQSEYAFLTGIPNSVLAIDRINPYLRMPKRGLESMVTRLKALGYRTVCVHPAKKEFFRRNTAIPGLGFEEFIGLEAFDDEQRFGPYISDAALGDHIETLIADHHATSDQPIFVFVITIESHGPWEMGRLSRWLDEEELKAAEPTGDHAFALYRHHMDHALALFRRLGPDATAARPRAMALYGDHQPALRALFDSHGLIEEEVNYLLWTSTGTHHAPGDVKIENLAAELLKAAGLRD
ncbi:MAG: LTA synthase family protein [Alphaproteobacteria bacterium]|nr:MAG: LTA synthase family protein [Alphaproteobacteria bacterium]